MIKSPVFFSSPMGRRRVLTSPPRLASWDRSDSSAQVALKAYLDEACALLDDDIPHTEALVGLRLDVGQPAEVALLAEHDLDNYALPLATRVTGLLGRRLSSVWCTKQHTAESTITVGPVSPVDSGEADVSFAVRTSGSAQSVAFKQQILAVAAEHPALPDGPVMLHVGFAVSAERNWLNLWKPVIDSLDPLLGRTRPDREWHPLDGRIIELGLHLTVDDDLGDDVALAIRASAMPQVSDLPSAALADTTVPPRGSSEPDVIAFAMAGDAFANGDIEALADVARRAEDRWTRTGGFAAMSSTELRAALYFLQRKARHTEDPRPFGTQPLVRAILDELVDRR